MQLYWILHGPVHEYSGDIKMSNFPAAGVYTVDPVHSTFTFVARHLVVSKVRGRFADFEGTITVDTAMRDGHIRSNDFLAQETYPPLSFKSTSLTSKGGDAYELVGDLTIRDVTKSVTFKAEFQGTGPSTVPGGSVIGF